MLNVFDVAKHILTTIGGEISTMKLQKLCYYSQAWNLVWEGVPLFKEDFLKWDNGPVCRALFDLHKGKFKISSDDILESYLSGENLSSDCLGTIEQVLYDYGKLDGKQLSDKTHSENPWIDAKKDEVITKESIWSYYELLPEATKYDDPYFSSEQFLEDVSKTIDSIKPEDLISLDNLEKSLA